MRRGRSRTGIRAVTAIVVTALMAACAPASTDNGQGWAVTVYYTAVEAFHDGASKSVRGCPTLDCRRGNSDLGEHPADFVQAVHDEGTGRLTDGGYLNWSSDVGYWLDTAPRDSHGRPLEPFRSAAADGLAEGTTVRLTGCGHQEDGSPVAPELCGRLSAPQWQIRDEFTPGLGGRRHIDLYIGEETGPDFLAQPIVVTLVGATVRTG